MNEFSPGIIFFLSLLVLWTIPWKAVALWKSARNSQLVWFIIFLLISTAGILEIIYIFFWSKNKK